MAFPGTGKIWMNGRLVDWKDATIHVASHVIQYATFFRGMLTRGIYPPPSQFEAWFLSAAHTVRDVDETIRAARAAMREVRG